MDDATQYIPTMNRVFSLRYEFGDGDLSIDTLMGASTVVVLSVLAHCSTQVWLIDDQNLVQTFFPYGSHPSFDIGIGVRRLTVGRDDVDAL